MSLAKRLFNNILWLFISEFCTKGVALITSLYLARVLSVAGFGTFSLALASGTYLSILVDMGIMNYGVREIAKNREKAASLMNVMNSMRLVIAGVILLAIIGYFSFGTAQSEKQIIFILVGWYVVSTALSADWVFQGLERTEYLALVNAVMAAIFLALIFLFVRTPHHTLNAIFYRSISYLMGSIFSLYLLKKMLNIRFSFVISLHEWWFHVKESIYFAINNALNNIALYMPLLFLGALATIHEVGLFSAPQKLVLALLAIPNLIAAASYPIMSSIFATDNEKFYRMHNLFERIMLFIGMPIGILGTVLSNKIMLTLFGGSYAASSVIFGVLIWMTPLMFLRFNYGRTLASAGFQRLNMFATGSGSLVSVALCLVLVPLFGSVGAAVAAVAGEAIVLIVMWLMFRGKIYRANPFNLFFLKVLLAGILIGIFLHYTDRSLIFSAITGTVLYGIVSLIIGVYSIDNLKKIYQKISGWPTEAAR